MQRALLAAIDNTEAIAAPQRVDYSNPSLGATEADRTRLDEVAVRAAFQREHDERVDAAAELRQHGQDDAAAGVGRGGRRDRVLPRPHGEACSHS